MSTSSVEERTRLRQSFKRARSEVHDPAQRAETIAQHILPMIEGSDIVAAYQAMSGEVSLEPLFRARPEQSWALPRTGEQQTMTFHQWYLSDVLESGEYGIAVPAGDAPVVTPTVVLVPLVAFDRTGTRLGMGGGYYDRYLDQLPREIPKIGVAFDCQRSEQALPKEEWDVTLSKVVTESGVLEFA